MQDHENCDGKNRQEGRMSGGERRGNKKNEDGVEGDTLSCTTNSDPEKHSQPQQTLANTEDPAFVSPSVSSISPSGKSSSASGINSLPSFEDTSRQKSTNRGQEDDPSRANAEEKKQGKKRRKRKRPYFLELTVSLTHNRRHPWDDDAPDHDPHRNAYDTPDFVHFAHLTAALLLCSVMAVVSALDAKMQCLQHETYAILQLVDDDIADLQAAYDTAVLHESDKCIQMFEQVVLPSGVATAVCALTVLAILYRYIKTSSSAAAAVKTTTETVNSKSQEGTSTKPAAVPPPHSSTTIRVTVALFFLFVAMLGLQIYNVTAIMLTPRADYTVNVNNDDDDQAAEVGENPYQSLAAVDRFGQVGDNANLYYLSWLCVGLAIALAYQVTTACFRVLRAARRHSQNASTSSSDGLLRVDPLNNESSSSKNRKLLPSTSWDHDMSRHSFRNLMMDAYDQSRAAWYGSLYRLRMRTGIWTAACISCLIIVASSQYIWNQVLWPYVSVVVRNERGNVAEETTFHFFSVCQKASSQSDGYFAPQLCRRTLTAWLNGLVAAILCATAIVLHLAARYRSATAASPTSSPPVVPDESSESESYYYDYYDHDVIQLLAAEDACSRTTVSAWKSAALNSLINRYHSHHHPNRLSLRTELVLSILLSLLLGINAVLVTSVQGPAPKVSNLYYASWLSFLLCIRICLGCVEEFYNIEHDNDEEEHGVNQFIASKSTTDSAFVKKASGEKDGIELANESKHAYRAPDLHGVEVVQSNSIVTSRDDRSVAPVPMSADSNSIATTIEKQEKTRLRRVRGYFFLSNFSIVCTASAFDAASNQNKALSRTQLYMVVAPGIVTALSTILFCLCLSKRCYSIVSRFWVGGLLSILTFGIWLADLILTMHSEDSWAVNGIGDIEMANLYYFSWGSIILSGIQMTSYVKALFGIKTPDYMSLLWAAICKICFVILGAGLHIWHTISDNCAFDEITLGAATFCSRTVLAITISLVGMLVGGLVVIGRLLVLVCPICKCSRIQAHIEMLISLFLVFLFGAAVSLTTGIGGPAQSVGDLYYSTWLAFWVSLGIFISCFNELNEEEKEMEGPTRIPTTENKTTEETVLQLEDRR